MNKIAFVFPGQGSQVVGMGLELYEKYDAAKQVFDFCGNKDILCQGEKLNETVNAQPALFAAGLASARALQSCGVNARGAAGFSLGEIPALAFAGLLDEKEAFDFVNFRAKVMHECSQLNKGGMAAVMGIGADDVIDLCRKSKGVYPVNFNAPSQTVVAFEEASGEAFIEAAKAVKAKVIPLKVSGAFHSPLMQSAAEEIKKYLENINFQTPKIPLYSNVTGRIYGNNPKELLTNQVNNPVKWQTTIEQMTADGFNIFIETGPGKTLTGLIKRIDKEVKTYNVFDAESLENTVKELGGQA